MRWEIHPREFEMAVCAMTPHEMRGLSGAIRHLADTIEYSANPVNIGRARSSLRVVAEATFK